MNDVCFKHSSLLNVYIYMHVAYTHMRSGI